LVIFGMKKLFLGIKKKQFLRDSNGNSGNRRRLA
jgi:hypothetical protein